MTVLLMPCDAVVCPSTDNLVCMAHCVDCQLCEKSADGVVWCNAMAGEVEG